MNNFIAGIIVTMVVLIVVGVFVFMFFKIKRVEQNLEEHNELLIEVSKLAARLGVEHLHNQMELDQFQQNMDLKFPNSEGL